MKQRQLGVILPSVEQDGHRQTIATPLKFGWSITAEYGTSNHRPGSFGLCGCFSKALYPPFAISHSASACWPSPVSQHDSPTLFLRLLNHALSSGRFGSCEWALPVPRKATALHPIMRATVIGRILVAPWAMFIEVPPK